MSILGSMLQLLVSHFFFKFLIILPNCLSRLFLSLKLLTTFSGLSPVKHMLIELPFPLQPERPQSFKHSNKLWTKLKNSGGKTQDGCFVAIATRRLTCCYCFVSRNSERERKTKLLSVAKGKKSWKLKCTDVERGWVLFYFFCDVTGTPFISTFVY